MKIPFARFFEKRTIEEVNLGDASDFGRWLQTRLPQSAAGVSVDEGTALGLPAAYSCINVLAQTVANIPLQLMKAGKNGPKPAFTHPLYDLMAFQPNDDSTAFNWRQTLEGHRNGWGNSFALINRTNGMPDNLEILKPDRTELRQNTNGDFFYRSQDDNHNQIVALPADVLHFKGLGFNGRWGYSPVQLHAEAIGLGIAIHKFGGSFFGNGLSPKGVLETEMPANVMEKWADELKATYGGLDMANGTPVLPKGVTYKPMTINPDDAQTLETLKYNRTEVCGIYRVPPSFIMDLQFNTFSNAKDQDLHFIKHTMLPILINWEQELSLKLLTVSERRRGFFFEFDVRQFMRGDPNARADFYHKGLTDGWLNRNEVRGWESLETVEGLSEFLTPGNMVGDDEDKNTDPQEGEGDGGKDKDDEGGSEHLDDKKKKDEERMMGLVLPLVHSLAERMATKERRSTEKFDIEDKSHTVKLAKFYDEDYPKFIERHLYPIALLIEPEEGSMEFIKRFSESYLTKQRSKAINKDLVSEGEIIKTFYEVIQWNDTKTEQ